MARRAAIRVKVLAPAYTSPAKIAQVRAYGAEVELVEGPREASQAEAIRQSAQTFYASHNWQPFFLEGTKTLAYELWEDFGFAAPDAVIVPVGAGSLLLGLWFGFKELLRAGQIARACRASTPPSRCNCSPVAASFAAGVDTPVAREVTPTVAEGTAIKAPLRLKPMIAALRESGGEAVAVTEEEIVAALRRLAAQGLFVEPTSRDRRRRADAARRGGPDRRRAERIVVVLSGSGLKAAATVAELCGG